ncbi:MAG TPA: hypothetical protein VFU69_09430 [Ktedonobacterales bacterium]|nr:hypothetical protein [Ktedonobacterales bacterium]
MNKQRIQFSPVELMLVVMLLASLLLGLLQARRDEARQRRA